MNIKTKFETYTIDGNCDIDELLQTQSRELKYFVSLPENINSDTGLCIVIGGCGQIAYSEYVIDKLMPSIAKNNFIVVSLEYFGMHNRFFQSQAYKQPKLHTDTGMTFWIKNLYGIDEKEYIINDVFDIEKLANLLKAKGITCLDRRIQVRTSDATEEYVSFGLMPAIDGLSVVGDILSKYNINKNKIVLYGSSYGGYIALLMAKFAPNTFSTIIANSPFLEINKSNLHYLYGEYSLVINDVIIFGRQFCPYQLTSSTLKNYMSEDAKRIRSLLFEEDYVASDTQYFVFFPINDEFVSSKQAINYENILSKTNTIYMKIITQNDIDSKIFKNTFHGMDASLISLFNMVYKNHYDSFTKKQTTTDFDNETVISFCYEKETYIFKFYNNGKLKTLKNSNHSPPPSKSSFFR